MNTDTRTAALSTLRNWTAELFQARAVLAIMVDGGRRSTEIAAQQTRVDYLRAGQKRAKLAYRIAC
jgi:hypothetical protein